MADATTTQIGKSFILVDEIRRSLDEELFKLFETSRQEPVLGVDGTLIVALSPLSGLAVTAGDCDL